MKLATLACTTALLAAASTAAHADGDTSADHRDPGTATMLSLGGSLAGAAMFFGGLASSDEGLFLGGMAASVVAPSIGHWYAGEAGGVGMAVRAGGLALMFVGAVSSICLSESDDSCSQNNGSAMLAVGGVAMVGGMIYDIATASDAAERYNAKHSYALGPTMVSTGGAPAVGVGISGSF